MSTNAIKSFLILSTALMLGACAPQPECVDGSQPVDRLVSPLKVIQSCRCNVKAAKAKAVCFDNEVCAPDVADGEVGWCKTKPEPVAPTPPPTITCGAGTYADASNVCQKLPTCGPNTHLDNSTPTAPKCVADTVVVQPTCVDGIQNGTETGVDCGGSCANACSPPPATFPISLKFVAPAPGAGQFYNQANAQFYIYHATDLGGDTTLADTGEEIFLSQKEACTRFQPAALNGSGGSGALIIEVKGKIKGTTRWAGETGMFRMNDVTVYIRNTARPGSTYPLLVTGDTNSEGNLALYAKNSGMIAGALGCP